jgi:CxxC-x17-CxxC domain-containing protein
MLYTDQIIACVDCTTEFSFSAKEQEFYAQKGFASSPKRCKPCRNARKDVTTNGGGFTRPSGDGTQGNYASSGGSGYGAPREREMHTVMCAACAIETQVPFKPRGDRPVYCRACFQKNG